MGLLDWDASFDNSWDLSSSLDYGGSAWDSGSGGLTGGNSTTYPTTGENTNSSWSWDNAKKTVYETGSNVFGSLANAGLVQVGNSLLSKLDFGEDNSGYKITTGGIVPQNYVPHPGSPNGTRYTVGNVVPSYGYSGDASRIMADYRESPNTVRMDAGALNPRMVGTQNAMLWAGLAVAGVGALFYLTR